MKHNITIKQKIMLVMFGILLSAIIIEISLRGAGFIYLSLQEHSNIEYLMQKNRYRIMCIGDSNTALGGRYSYPRQLERILNERVSGIQFAVINKGIPGANTGLIISQLKDNLDKYQPHMVVVMMGTNDLESPSYYLGSISSYKDYFFTRIKSFIKTLRIYKLVKLLKRNASKQSARNQN